MKINGRHLAVAAAMCGVSAASIGLIMNVSGFFFTPMAEEFGIMQGASSMVLTIASIALALGGLATKKLTEKLPLRMMLLCATAVLAGSTIATAFAPNIFVAYILAATKGLAAGVCGFVLIALVLGKWFASQTALVTSIAMGSSGLAGALFSPVVQAAVAGLGWRGAQVVVGALMALLMLPAIILIPSVDPADAGLEPFGASATATSASAKSGGGRVDGAVFAIVVVFAVLFGALPMLPQHFPGIADLAGFSAAGAAMVSACMITNTAGKVVLGWLCDRLGAKRSILIYAIVIVGALAVFLLVASPAPYVVAAFFYGLCYSPGTVGLTALCREIFGEGAGTVYPVGNMAYSLSSAIASSAIGFAYDLTGAYTIVFAAFIAFVAAALALLFASYAKRA